MLHRHGSKANKAPHCPRPQLLQVLDARTCDRVNEWTAESRASGSKRIERFCDPVTCLVVEAVDPVEDFVDDVDAPLIHSQPEV
jgi:hypothetical protein